MTENKNLRVAVIGMGPVGSVLAAHFAKAGAYVVACDIIPDRIKNIKNSGIKLSNTIEFQTNVSETCTSIDDLKSHDLDLAVVSVKTTANEKVVAQLSQIASDKLHILCAQNGLDAEAEAARVFGLEKILRMVVNYAGGVENNDIVNVTFFNPPNYIAALSPKSEEIAKTVTDFLNSANLKTEIPEDILFYVWEKVILNSSLSAMCAITGKTMKQVMDFDLSVDIVRSIIDEGVAVAAKENIKFREDFTDFCIGYLKKAGHHRPSMWVDIDAGALTEVDYLNGKIVEYGIKHGISTPINKTITAQVHLMELPDIEY
ncbi:MAG: ketopantoate reductase family protein [candidate division Zixibacteria bacterium]